MCRCPKCRARFSDDILFAVLMFSLACTGVIAACWWLLG